MSFDTSEERWKALEDLQLAYPHFQEFLYDVITGLMGFTCTPLQLDIATYLEFGPTYRMIQAQRGQAKTTITACYSVWRIIHNPTCRILILSAGDTQATEIANWIIQIINNMDELECLRPDKAHGDRASVEAFDVHWQLKGPEKSPSIACAGITSNLQGKRADILIPDDIESQKNSQTEVQRERIKHLTRDFSSICSTGDIIYLGTPQSIDSVYNGLISRGFDIRIWPGRFPTLEEEENYGALLAPVIKDAMAANPSLRTGGGPLGDRGKPTDPQLLSEATLTKKEIDQGKSYFQLQHMLDTKLMDKDRFPLDLSKVIFLNVPKESAPIEIFPMRTPENRILPPSDFPIEAPMYMCSNFGREFGKLTNTYMYVDPAGGGQNGDETAYAVTKFMSGRVFLVDAGGVKGGINDASLNELTRIAIEHKVKDIGIERNFGNGALASVWTPKLLKDHPCGIEEQWESGQKELRIIDILEPVIGAGKLVVDADLIRKDWKECEKYPVQDRPSYSLFYQLSRITRDKGSLLHEDRLDAVAGAVRKHVEALQQDDEKAANKARMDRYKEMMKDPIGNGRSYSFYKLPNSNTPTAANKMKRRF